MVPSRLRLRFAMEHSVIFRDPVAKGGKYMQGYDEQMMPILVEEMQKDPELEGFTTRKGIL